MVEETKQNSDGTLNKFLNNFNGEPSEGLPENTKHFTVSHEKPWCDISEQHLREGLFNWTKKEDIMEANLKMFLSSMDRLSPENIEKQLPGFDFSGDSSFYQSLSQAEKQRFHSTKYN